MHPPPPPVQSPPPIGGTVTLTLFFLICSLVLPWLVLPASIDPSLHLDTNVCHRRTCLVPLS